MAAASLRLGTSYPAHQAAISSLLGNYTGAAPLATHRRTCRGIQPEGFETQYIFHQMLNVLGYLVGYLESLFP